MTLTEAETRLAAALAAYDAAAASPVSSAGYNERSVSYRPLESLQASIDYWQRRVNELRAAGRGVRNRIARVAVWS